MEWFPCPTYHWGWGWLILLFLSRPQFELIHYLAERERERYLALIGDKLVHFDSNLVKLFWDIHHTVHVKLSFTNLNLLLIIFPVGFVIIMLFLMSDFGNKGIFKSVSPCVCVFLGFCNHYYYYYYSLMSEFGLQRFILETSVLWGMNLDWVVLRF